MSTFAIRRRRKSSGDCMTMICRGLSNDHSALETRKNFTQNRLPDSPPPTPTKSMSQATQERIAEARKKWRVSRSSQSSFTPSYTTSSSTLSLSCPRPIFKPTFEHPTPLAVKEEHHDQRQAYHPAPPSWSLPHSPPLSPTSELAYETPRPPPVAPQPDLVRRTIVDNPPSPSSAGKPNRMSSVRNTLKRNASLILPKVNLSRLEEHGEHHVHVSAQQRLTLTPLRERPAVGRRTVSDDTPQSHPESSSRHTPSASATPKRIASVRQTLKRSASSVLPKLYQVKLRGITEQSATMQHASPPTSRPRPEVEQRTLRTMRYEETSSDTNPPIPY